MLLLDHLTLTAPDFRLMANLTISQGARVALIGPSGAGKSTLLNAIAGFVPPQSGRILWQGQSITETNPGQRPVTILFQDQNLFPHLTLERNLALGLAPDGRLIPDIRDKVAKALDRTGLHGLAQRKPGQLSGGQQGRAALARALLRARPLLLLDEPFAALGPALKRDMLALVAEVAAETGATVLMVTHDPQDAKTFADQTILVADGLAHPPQDTAMLFATPPKALTAYLGQGGS
ncbi:ATP-binding cassette domain-containing protein [Fuscovulum ytuae]|uniref:ATP-binding cassette domain-containing protein n=1 Tax=Fuscovulum ytuae TaxID=3042299 RepID=A0ABY8Q2M7_9RHOB|nr:ATP-binding cassette domain-containing protein [Fuscovulum sp. YMD61]WGV15058.1 ATP-binding cassette domain-containing protein [Fuscovulum sp. YMD61]